MSTAATVELPHGPSAGPKNKKSKKKKSGGGAKPNGNLKKSNGAKADDNNDRADEEEEEELEQKLELEPEVPAKASISFQDVQDSKDSNLTENGGPLCNGSSHSFGESPQEAIRDEDSEALFGHRPASSTAVESPRRTSFDRARDLSVRQTSPADTESRLETLAQERAALRDEIFQLRRSLEALQEQHKQEISTVQDQLEERTEEKEHAEIQYRNLLGKVNTIRSQLGERLKADADDLAQARARIEDLEEERDSLRGQNEARTIELSTLAEESEQKSKELSSLRNRTTLSQQNWTKERDDLIQREAFAREEFEAAKQAMQDWEILAIEERSTRETAAEKLSDLKEQLSNLQEAYEKATTVRDSQALTVEGLQRALQEIQDARRKELRELVENSQVQVENLQKVLHDTQLNATEAAKELDTTKQELERALPFEKEVKEKNLLIGKLRHEAVILNDHLTKALRYLKKGRPEDNIDKQLVTNHFLHFLGLERADPKKFQVLQIIAALLGWTDEQREQAGLARPGASNPNLRVPISPWHRTPSTPSLSTDFLSETSSRKESLAELWSDFLDQEAQEGTKSPKSPSDSARSASASGPYPKHGLGISSKP